MQVAMAPSVGSPVVEMKGNISNLFSKKKKVAGLGEEVEEPPDTVPASNEVEEEESVVKRRLKQKVEERKRTFAFGFTVSQEPEVSLAGGWLTMINVPGGGGKECVVIDHCVRGIMIGQGVYYEMSREHRLWAGGCILEISPWGCVIQCMT